MALVNLVTGRIMETASCDDALHRTHAHALPHFVAVIPAQHTALRRRRQDATLSPAERDRVEVILRSHQGESLHGLDADLEYNYETVSLWLQAPDSTWTSAQLAWALAAEHQIQFSARQCRKYLQAMGATWRRTQANLQHQQDPQRVAQAQAELPALKKSTGMGLSSFSSWTKRVLP